MNNQEALIMRLDSNGSQLWTQSYASSGFEDLFGMVACNDGGFVFTGRCYNNLYVFKIDAAGGKEWVQTYGYYPGNEDCYGLVHTWDGGFAVVGETLNSLQTFGALDVF